MTETKRTVRADDDDDDGDNNTPVISSLTVRAVAIDAFKPSAMLTDKEDMTSSDGLFALDKMDAANFIQGKGVDWFQRMNAPMKTSGQMTTKEIINGVSNYYRPCPTAIQTAISPVGKLRLTVFPSGDAPKVEDLITNGVQHYPIQRQLLPEEGRILIISKAELRRYGNHGLFYPTRLHLSVNGKPRQVLQNKTKERSALTTFDADRKPTGVLIEPNQSFPVDVDAGLNLSGFDVEKAAWVSRLAGMRPKAVLRQIQELKQWKSSPSSLGVAAVSIKADTTDYNLVQWMVGRFWRYLWHSLVTQMATEDGGLDRLVDMRPSREDGTVPVLRTALVKLFKFLLHLSAKEWTIGAKDTLGLQQGFDMRAIAYKNLRTERKGAKDKGLQVDFDEHLERFHPSFELDLEFFSLETDDEMVDVDIPDLESVSNGGGGGGGSFAGRVRQLRATPGFKSPDL